MSLSRVGLSLNTTFASERHLPFNHDPAVFSFAWNNQFRYLWQWGILVMFVGLALMLSGVFIMWLHIEVDTSFYLLDTRLKKVEKELRATQQPEA